ncbi:hypothetical protein H072_1192 [Dactylellina haptotyla CBS 200.50]|uniref:Cytochrome b-c1 complex subunit 8 n=1 Tax=Dactylellina haptotyla (strain CBS 200.50) TaxID=1284197 RepID=S8APJ5_DACHA|nr:hypothetical protein H072_1192 [Dactylellina haptotyla CBS 200.50]
MGGGGKRAPGSWIGDWGNFGLSRQRGIVQYTLAANRQVPTANLVKSAIFNGFRRFRGQVLYITPPFVGIYLLMEWANKRNEFLNSKAGIALYADEED